MRRLVKRGSDEKLKRRLLKKKRLVTWTLFVFWWSGADFAGFLTADDGDTAPTIIAAMNDHLDIVHFLEQRGANVKFGEIAVGLANAICHQSARFQEKRAPRRFEVANFRSFPNV